MTTWNDRNSFLYKAKQVVEQFADRNIELPATVLDAVKVWQRVADAKPTKPEPTAIRQAIIAGATQADIDALLVADLGATRYASEWQQAHVDAAGAVLAAVRDAEPVLLPALRKQADVCIEKLTQVAALGGVKLDHLIRAGRQSDAKLLADVDLTAASLTGLYHLRDSFLLSGGGRMLTVNGVNVARWRDPVAAAKHAVGSTPTEEYLNGLAAGVPLWFPSGQEAADTARQIAEGRAAEAQRARDAERGIGSFVAFN